MSFELGPDIEPDGAPDSGAKKEFSNLRLPENQTKPAGLPERQLPQTIINAAKRGGSPHAVREARLERVQEALRRNPNFDYQGIPLSELTDTQLLELHRRINRRARADGARAEAKDKSEFKPERHGELKSNPATALPKDMPQRTSNLSPSGGPLEPGISFEVDNTQTKLSRNVTGPIFPSRNEARAQSVDLSSPAAGGSAFKSVGSHFEPVALPPLSGARKRGLNPLEEILEKFIAVLIGLLAALFRPFNSALAARTLKCAVRNPMLWNRRHGRIKSPRVRTRR